MGFRFHRSFGLGKLFRLNVGKKSASVSVGVPGFRYNIGTRGSRATFGVPGTGLSYSTRLGASTVMNTSVPSRSTGSGCLAVVMLGVLAFLGIILVGVVVQSLNDPKAGIPVAILSSLFVAPFIAGTVALWVWLIRRKKRAAMAELERQQAEQLHAAERDRLWQEEQQPSELSKRLNKSGCNEKPLSVIGKLRRHLRPSVSDDGICSSSDMVRRKPKKCGVRSSGLVLRSML